MASSKNQQQVLWSAASSITLNSATRQDSDEIAFHVEDLSAAIQVSADNQGTPASGDVVRVYAKWTTGDVLGDSGNDYDTSEHAELIAVLDTFSTNTPGEDPARKTVSIDVADMVGMRLSVEAPQGATRSIVVRARVVTYRGQ